MKYEHTPVMLNEVSRYLNPSPGRNFIDCTLGGGGYTLAIARKVGKGGSVLAIDLDEAAVENLKSKAENLKLNIKAVRGNFRDLRKIVEREFKGRRMKFDGIVFDLGLSSAQLEDSKRGFSFRADTPLKMEFGSDVSGFSAEKTEDIVNKWPRRRLEKILREYGEERYAGRIANAIVKEREREPIRTTGRLVDIIRASVPPIYARGRIHFATRTFQALRIATNKELENLELALPQALDLLAAGGRMAIVSFHSLEDRIVKRFFKKENKGCLCPATFPLCRCGHRPSLKIATSKPIAPSAKEIRANPRARSAKLRVAEKV